jgi:hypothetical protein
MADRAPTLAQKRFAQGLALGKSTSNAYRIAHPEGKTTGKALATLAQKAKRQKNVQDELARLMAEPMIQPLLLEPFPEYQDARRIREHAVGLMVKLTSHSDPVVAMHAAIWLFDYSTVLIEDKKPRPKSESRADILRELRETYARSLNPPLIVEASVDPVGTPQETPAGASQEQLEAAEDTPPWEDPQENSAEPIPDSGDST